MRRVVRFLRHISSSTGARPFCHLSRPITSEVSLYVRHPLVSSSTHPHTRASSSSAHAGPSVLHSGRLHFPIERRYLSMAPYRLHGVPFEEKRWTSILKERCDELFDGPCPDLSGAQDNSRLKYIQGMRSSRFRQGGKWARVR